jgi:hypothetical protein
MDRMKKAVLLLTGGVLLLFVVLACASQQVAPPPAEKTMAQAAVASQPKAALEAPKEEAKPAPPYTQEVKPLTPEECARCHLSVYNQIKNEGGKHKIECVRCHKIYHGYNPVKQNWTQIMPKCQTCHGLIHGGKFESCQTCHTNPHAPKTQMVMSPGFAKVCGDCHAKVNEELQKNPSKHTKVQCAVCHHDKHGYVPSCMECHKPHTAGQTDKDCLACHPVHEPLKVTYPPTTKNEVCGSCHSQVYNKIKTTKSRHGQVPCAKCHTRHRYIPKCEECHGKPHGEVVMKKFPNCLQCHVDAHDLPSGGGKK